MFTGLIEQLGIIIAILDHQGGKRLVIDAFFQDLVPGESLSVNGVCLTLLPDESEHLVFDVSPETLAVTNLQYLNKGDNVNLERAMQASARFGGHYVSGHVDKTATIRKLTETGDFVELIIDGFSIADLPFLLTKGSITVDGISLTINAVKEDSIHIMLVPHTLHKTTLSTKIPGQSVNIEFDYLTRVIAHQLQCARASV